MIKSGANFQDQNAIKAWAAEGKSAAQISKLVGVKVDCVERFMNPAPAPEPVATAPAPEPAEEPKKKTRRRAPTPVVDVPDNAPGGEE